MFLRLLSVVVLAFVVSGCATTQNRSQQEQLQSRVTELEKKVEAKDAEIVDLQYAVKDLSGKVDPAKSGSSEEVATPVAPMKSSDSSEVIRVNVSVEKVQKALKGAGLYTGKIDGKLGAGTKSAIVEFQKSQGLKADGILGRKSWDALKAYLK